VRLLLSLTLLVSFIEPTQSVAQAVTAVTTEQSPPAARIESRGLIPVPMLKGHVNDYAGILTEQQRADMEARLATYERETAHQIVVLTVPTLGGEQVESFSLRVANAWQLGRKDLDNGVLVTVSPSDRTARIELGRGMSLVVSDAVAMDIMVTVMTPEFRAGRYANGIQLGVERLMKECRAFKVKP
jgi:uncharacterized protein